MSEKTSAQQETLLKKGAQICAALMQTMQPFVNEVGLEYASSAVAGYLAGMIASLPVERRAIATAGVTTVMLEAQIIKAAMEANAKAEADAAVKH